MNKKPLETELYDHLDLVHDVHLKSGDGEAAERYAKTGIEALKGLDHRFGHPWS